MKKLCALMLAASLLAAFTSTVRVQAGELRLTADIKAATAITAEVNSAVYSVLDFGNTRKAQLAEEGLIDAPETLELTDA
ncbi:MAG: MBL fold metallo-hydrolase, partial [Clostridiales bacterium]|nr:MBL fold metallo-hydrolase [Clostridiales bacterium]